MQKLICVDIKAVCWQKLIFFKISFRKAPPEQVEGYCVHYHSTFYIQPMDSLHHFSIHVQSLALLEFC